METREDTCAWDSPRRDLLGLDLAHGSDEIVSVLPDPISLSIADAEASNFSSGAGGRVFNDDCAK